MQYMEKHGPLGPERLYDRPAALVAWMLARVNGGKNYTGQMRDFMPWPQVEEAPISFAEVASAFSTAKKGR